MAEHKDKTQLLAEMQAGYDEFEALLAPLNEEQLTTSGVNGDWSIKDNLAHLSAWQRYVLDALQAAQKGVEFSHPWQKMNDDDINEQIYQANKGRPLTEVRSEFRSAYQLLRDRVVMLTAEELNSPYPNRTSLRWEHVAGNMYEHFREHGGFSQRLWAQQKTGTEA